MNYLCPFPEPAGRVPAPPLRGLRRVPCTYDVAAQAMRENYLVATDGRAEYRAMPFMAGPAVFRVETAALAVT